MPMIKKSITVTDKHADFIQSQIASGGYASDSEVIRDALRLKERQLEHTKALRAALLAGSESGTSNETPEEMLANIKSELRNNGEL